MIKLLGFPAKVTTQVIGVDLDRDVVQDYMDFLDIVPGQAGGLLSRLVRVRV